MAFYPIIFPAGPYPSTANTVPDGTGNVVTSALFVENVGDNTGDNWIILGSAQLDGLLTCVKTNPDPSLSASISVSYDVTVNRALAPAEFEALITGIFAFPLPASGGNLQALEGFGDTGNIDAVQPFTGSVIRGSTSDPANPYDPYVAGATFSVTASGVVPLDSIVNNQIAFTVNTQNLDVPGSGQLEVTIENLLVVAEVDIPPVHPCASSFADIVPTVTPLSSNIPTAAAVPVTVNWRNEGPATTTGPWQLSVNFSGTAVVGSAVTSLVPTGWQIWDGGSWIPFNTGDDLLAFGPNVLLLADDLPVATDKSITFSLVANGSVGDTVDVKINNLGMNEAATVSDTTPTGSGVTYTMVGASVVTVTASDPIQRIEVDPGQCDSETITVELTGNPAALDGLISALNLIGGTVAIQGVTAPTPIRIDGAYQSYPYPVTFPSVHWDTDGVLLNSGDQVVFDIEVCFPLGAAPTDFVELNISATADNVTFADAGHGWFTGSIEAPACAIQNPVALGLGPFVELFGAGAADISQVVLDGQTHATTGSFAGAIAGISLTGECPAGALKEVTVSVVPTYGTVPDSGWRWAVGGIDAGGTPLPNTVVAGSHPDLTTIEAADAPSGATPPIGYLLTVPAEQMGAGPATVIFQTTADNVWIGVDDTGFGATAWTITVSAVECANCVEGDTLCTGQQAIVDIPCANGSSDVYSYWKQ